MKIPHSPSAPELVLQRFRVSEGLSCVIGPFGQHQLTPTLRQHCPFLTRNPCTFYKDGLKRGPQVI